MARSEELRNADIAGETSPAFERAWFETSGAACRTPQGLLSRREFFARTDALADSLDHDHPRQPALLACEDTLNFAIGFCALLRADRDILLPPNLQPATLADPVFAGSLRIDDSRVAACAATGDRPPAAFNPDQRITLFTSGSTGQPKRIQKRLRQLSAEADILEAHFGADVADAGFAATVPHIHIYGMLFRVIWPLASGRIFATETPLGGNLPAGSEQALVSSPAFLGRIDPARLAASRPRVVFSSGGRLPPDCAQALALACDSPLIEVYGSTETGGIAWRKWQPACDEYWTPFAGVRAEVNDENILRVSSAATDTQWFVTGDSVQLEADGRFHLEGRADGVLKIEDKRVSPRALLEHLEKHSGVAEARLVQLATRRSQLGAVLRLRQAGVQRLATIGRAALVQELKEHMLQVFEAVVVPRRWRFVDAFPLNAMGKTTVADLAALFDTREDE